MLHLLAKSSQKVGCDLCDWGFCYRGFNGFGLGIWFWRTDSTNLTDLGSEIGEACLMYVKKMAGKSKFLRIVFAHSDKISTFAA